MSMRTILLVFALLLPALAGSRSFSKDGTFSLIAPPGWTVTIPARNTLLMTSGASEFEIESFAEAVPLGDSDYRQKIASSVDASEFKVVSQSDTRIAGEAAVQCELDGVGGKKDLVGRFMVLTDGRRTWFITYSAQRQDSGEAFGRVEDALRTLQLK